MATVELVFAASTIYSSSCLDVVGCELNLAPVLDLCSLTFMGALCEFLQNRGLVRIGRRPQIKCTKKSLSVSSLVSELPTIRRESVGNVSEVIDLVDCSPFNSSHTALVSCRVIRLPHVNV